tara:strand:- start:776 stop:1456 length:681 start_codon:yes stop_codon:yes gene_type:complete
MAVKIQGTNSVATPAVSNDGNDGLVVGTDTIDLSIGGAAKFKVGAAGQLGIGGATYGTSGHVLTSGGASAAPSWAAPDQSYFYAYRNNNSVQTITSDTITKVVYQSLIQSDSAFDISNDKWTATAADAGAWMFISQISFYTDGNDGNNCFVKIYKNGSQAAGGYNWIWRGTPDIGHFVSTIQFMDVVASGDYYESYGRIQGSGNEGFFGGDSSGGYKQTSFAGWKL